MTGRFFHTPSAGSVSLRRDAPHVHDRGSDACSPDLGGDRGASVLAGPTCRQQPPIRRVNLQRDHYEVPITPSAIAHTYHDSGPRPVAGRVRPAARLVYTRRRNRHGHANPRPSVPRQRQPGRHAPRPAGPDAASRRHTQGHGLGHRQGQEPQTRGGLRARSRVSGRSAPHRLRRQPRRGPGPRILHRQRRRRRPPAIRPAVHRIAELPADPPLAIIAHRLLPARPIPGDLRPARRQTGRPPVRPGRRVPCHHLPDQTDQRCPIGRGGRRAYPLTLGA
jgi:hypothetical protein